jgi:hypothetical protein
MVNQWQLQGFIEKMMQFAYRSNKYLIIQHPAFTVRKGLDYISLNHKAEFYGHTDRSRTRLVNNPALMVHAGDILIVDVKAKLKEMAQKFPHPSAKFLLYKLYDLPYMVMRING